MVCRAETPPAEHLWRVGCDHCGDDPVLLLGRVGDDAGFSAYCNANPKPDRNEHTIAFSDRYRDRDAAPYSDSGAIAYRDCYPNADANCYRDTN